MGYIPGYDFDIFVSYAHVDNEPLSRDQEGWVNHFCLAFKNRLAQIVGRSEKISIYRDNQIRGNDILDGAIINACRSSAILICIVSPGFLAAKWCLRELSEFRDAKAADRSRPEHPFRSRVFSIILDPHVRERELYQVNFGKSNGYEFFDSDTGLPLWADIGGLATQGKFERNIDELARDVFAILGVAEDSPESLVGILGQATKRVVISGHTINRFAGDVKVFSVLVELLSRGVRVSFIMLNPKSKYAEAHAPYHQLESGGRAEDQHGRAMEFLDRLFETVDGDAKRRLEVLLSHYMPRFRVILVDSQRAYLYLYMYGADVGDGPDCVFEKAVGSTCESPTFKKILSSTEELMKAPEMIPFVRDGIIYGYWEHSKLAGWDSWSPEMRRRHRLIHRYYFEHAAGFDQRFGSLLEYYLTQHLELLRGRALVLGCGSGKEVAFLAKAGKCTELLGADFCPAAIELARRNNPRLAMSFIVADFYDLEHFTEGNFDSVVANAAFVHLLERRDMLEILQKIYLKLNPGGQLLLRNLYKEVSGNPVHEEYFHSADRFTDSRWFVYYQREELAKYALEVGFVVDDGATKKIAKSCNVMKAVTIGFPHASVGGVFWPTVLLRRPKATRQP